MEKDKKLHLAGGIGVFVFVAAAFYFAVGLAYINASVELTACVAGTLASIAIAAILEWSNCDTPWGNRWKVILKKVTLGRLARGNTKWDWADFAYTCVPAIAVTGIVGLVG